MNDGGRRRPCEYQLKCNHTCLRQCHPSNHYSIICPNPCPKKCVTCGHQCTKICHFPKYCPPCQMLVLKSLQPRCGHRITLPCSIVAEGTICNELCSIRLHCGHLCKQKCGRACRPCEVNFIKVLQCGHQETFPCYEEPHKFICDQPYGKVMSPGCEHICRGTCRSCKQGTSHIPCKERCFGDLPCDHQCMVDCSEICPPCKNTCDKR